MHEERPNTLKSKINLKKKLCQKIDFIFPTWVHLYICSVSENIFQEKFRNTTQHCTLYCISWSPMYFDL